VLGYLSVFIAGIILGVVITLIIKQKINSQAESQSKIIIDKIKDSFGMLSFDALSKNTKEFLKLAEQTLSKQTGVGEKELEGKKKLIDQTLWEMKGNLERDLQRVQNLVKDIERDREKKFGELTNQLKSTAEQTVKLQETTNQLQSTLASRTDRGQWGQRIVEDVLRFAGFIEGINYQKQKAVENGTLPDFTFFLPQGRKVNMDVKFVWDNYSRYLKAGKTDKEIYRKQLLRNVRERIKEATTRNYINPADNTLDYVIVLIPNEQIYTFINENDRTILDEALKKKAILCSPTTLYAILAIIRQAMDNFNLERTTGQVLSLLGSFKKQYDAFMESFKKMGRKIDEAQREFETLNTTRRNKLERQLREIDGLRKQKEISSEASLTNAQ